MIESKDNLRFKNWMKLKQKKYRDEQGLYLVFGDKFIQMAKETNVLDEVVTSNPNKEGILISEKLMKELNFTETPFDVMGICKKIQPEITSNYILALDDIQNPDNLGALLRSALAFGFHEVILSHKTADLYNDKTLRAAQGAHFKLNVIRTSLYEKLIDLKNKGYRLLGADAHESKVNNKSVEKIVLILGNEGQGLSHLTKTIVDDFVHISMQGTESLNVSVAGSILMYEWSKKWH